MTAPVSELSCDCNSLLIEAGMVGEGTVGDTFDCMAAHCIGEGWLLAAGEPREPLGELALGLRTRFPPVVLAAAGKLGRDV